MLRGMIVWIVVFELALLDGVWTCLALRSILMSLFFVSLHMCKTSEKDLNTSHLIPLSRMIKAVGRNNLVYNYIIVVLDHYQRGNMFCLQLFLHYLMESKLCLLWNYWKRCASIAWDQSSRLECSPSFLPRCLFQWLLDSDHAQRLKHVRYTRALGKSKSPSNWFLGNNQVIRHRIVSQYGWGVPHKSDTYWILGQLSQRVWHLASRLNRRWALPNEGWYW